jgi:hypothetical protein
MDVELLFIGRDNGATCCSRLLGPRPYLTAHSSNLAFIHTGFCHHICQGASSQILHDNPQLISHKVTAGEQIKGMKKFRVQEAPKLSFKG